MTHHIYDYDVVEVISTHTLTWSVTKILFFVMLHTIISTHTLTWSVTVEVILFIFFLEISTHTLTWSVTPYVQNNQDD